MGALDAERRRKFDPRGTHEDVRNFLRLIARPEKVDVYLLEEGLAHEIPNETA